MDTIFKIGSHVQIGQGRTEWQIIWMGDHDGVASATLISLYTHKTRHRYVVPTSELCLIY